MARIRTIKPEFFTSDDICALSPLARLLYVGLWCEADREGRLLWSPGVLKRRYLPDDTCEIATVAEELIVRKLIVLYGEGYAHIPSFARHQHVGPKEAQSRLPSPLPEASGESPQGRESEREREGKEGEGKAPQAGRAHALPEGWTPDDEDLAWAKTARPDLDRTALDAETERFRNHAVAHARTAHRWGPSWRLWVSKAHPPRPVSAGAGAGTARRSDGLPPDRDGADQWRARLSGYRPGKFWLEGDWGPRPESGKSRVPAAVLAEWQACQVVPEAGATSTAAIRSAA
jgi:hypothetical protein